MYKENEAELKFLGLDKWEKYQGHGIRCAEGEGQNKHAEKVLAVGTTFNTGIKTELLNCGLRMENGKLQGSFIDNLDYIKQNIDVLNLSVGGFYNEQVEKLFEELYAANVIVVTSAGNSADRYGVDGYAKSFNTLTIANSFLYKGKEVKRYRTSSVGEGIDFTMFGNWFIEYKGNKVQVNGTSFSSPFVAFVIIPKVQQFFIEKAGRRLDLDEMYNFLIDHTKYLGSPDKFGNGIIILPEPGEIDVNKYITKYVEETESEKQENIENGVRTMLDIQVFDGQITENFNISEFKCRANGEVLINAAVIDHIQRLQILREWYNRAINVNSGYRTPEYNKKIGGATNSFHMQGIASDIALPQEFYGFSKDRQNEFLSNIKNKWLELCKGVGLGGGVGFYDTFIHLDSRPKGNYKTGVYSHWDNRTGK
ncbi:D-Ala-D-Ala carboxypeptidase family metallohydrolase [Wukongibacter sp. M2B1]|uniref:YcbK family protein n=1 Tax=Wukongibacter sp. M2B1 TaxID=3088895 RepID=UPI003D78C538